MFPDRRAALLIASCFALGSCARPQPPRITPRAAAVSGVDATGLRLRVQLVANNPNDIDVTVRRIDVDVTIGGQALGRSTMTQPVALVAHRDVPITVDIAAGWRDLPGLIAASVLNENVPYRLDGTARVGGERLNVDVPFRMESTLPRRILMDAAGNTVNGMPR
jgi:LEA14-like dessication related protein